MDSLLAPECIAMNVAAPTREAVFDEIARLVRRRYRLPESEVVTRLWRRERRGSTALGWGMALPHAHVLGLGRPAAVFVRPATPVVFDAPDGQAVRNVFALLVPKPATAIHFELLRYFQRLCAQPSFRQRLDECGDASHVWRLFEQHMVK